MTTGPAARASAPVAAAPAAPLPAASVRATALTVPELEWTTARGAAEAATADSASALAPFLPLSLVASLRAEGAAAFAAIFNAAAVYSENIIWSAELRATLLAELAEQVAPLRARLLAPPAAAAPAAASAAPVGDALGALALARGATATRLPLALPALGDVPAPRRVVYAALEGEPLVCGR
jgi:hypothetical protein